MYSFLEIQGISNLIGVIGIIAAIGIGVRFLSPQIAMYGSILGITIFLCTLSFLITAPNLFTKAEGLWIPDGFVIKDLFLLGFCVWSAGEAYQTIYLSKTKINTVKKMNIIYWSVTIVMTAFMLMAIIPDLLKTPEAI